MFRRAAKSQIIMNAHRFSRSAQAGERDFYFVERMALRPQFPALSSW